MTTNGASGVPWRSQGRQSNTGAEREHLGVLIVGAGLSGVGAACHLARRCPEREYAILESREAIGGTWDLFRYPGIRSDSDMFTLGYSFKPWRGEKSIADGGSILDYIRETAREHEVEGRVRFGHRVLGAEWSSAEARWTVRAERDGEPVELTCDLLYSCTGYYRYDQGYAPEFPGAEDFDGEIVHPQHWPEDFDHAGKRVVVIGSGATAVTLVPALAEGAAQVTMLQRSPSFILSLPEKDRLATALRRRLPERTAYSLTRWKNMLLTVLMYQVARRAPRFSRRVLRKGVAAQLPPDYPVDRDFDPTYDPWDQRLCLVPGGDLFAAIRSGGADVVTDRIERFTAAGIRLASGRELEADAIVTATGLNLLLFGGIELAIDGEPVDPGATVAYKGMMLAGVPNFVFALGYTNASFTLKTDLVADYVCRLLHHMDARGMRVATPRRPDPALPTEPLINLSSGYVARALDGLPRQAASEPWRASQNYLRDRHRLSRGPLDDEIDLTAA